MHGAQAFHSEDCTRRATFSTIKYSSCASKLDSKGHLAPEALPCT